MSKKRSSQWRKGRQTEAAMYGPSPSLDLVCKPPLISQEAPINFIHSFSSSYKRFPEPLLPQKRYFHHVPCLEALSLKKTPKSRVDFFLLSSFQHQHLLVREHDCYTSGRYYPANCSVGVFILILITCRPPDGRSHCVTWVFPQTGLIPLIGPRVRSVTF
jgi:hypothetical protein